MVGQDGALYTEAFYSSLDGGAAAAARLVLPHVLGAVPVTSALDVGCGVGSWLAALQKEGVVDITGIDGELVPGHLMKIPAEHFRQVDLARPFSLGRKFDLVICTEVAEHLPPESADGFVESIAACTDLVLFSAAIPGQGGTGHINEQWQSYWASRFERQGFTTVDLVRPLLWDTVDDVFIIAQNLLCYARGEPLKLLAGASGIASLPLDVVHPKTLEAVLASSLGVRVLVRQVPMALLGAARRRMRLRAREG